MAIQYVSIYLAIIPLITANIKTMSYTNPINSELIVAATYPGIDSLIMCSAHTDDKRLAFTYDSGSKECKVTIRLAK